MAGKILIVDDDLGMRETLEAVLREDGYQVETAGDGAQAIRSVKGKAFDVILLDVRMPDASGLDVLTQVKRILPEAAVIMMTAYGTVKTAVEAVKNGAYDFLTKPFELDEVRLSIGKVLELQQLTRENKELRAMLQDRLVFREIIGTSKAMQEVFAVIRKVVDYDVTILICGESGTGKEMVAQAIHHNSTRRAGPFIKLNCAALPDTLLESELFGYDKGAFTGAVTAKPGRFELAEGGTLFLDEIGDTSPNMQAKLLRVLQEKEFERVGGRRTIKVDVRILAATNRDLKQEVEAKRFREDLYYRLNVVPISLPPLRERREDIPALVDHFLRELNPLFHKDFVTVSPEAMDCLMRYQWPGNVRELKNVLEKAILLGEGSSILITHLPEEIVAPRSGRPVLGANRASLDDLEREHIVQVLREVKWNQSKAAELLGIHRNTLRNKIERFNLREETRS
ncbi:MAG: sigma-54-dependent transcriptional regulator [Bacteroidota bacterium]